MSAASAEETRAEALFVSDLQRSEAATPQLIRETIAATVRRLGERGCAALVAQEFGEHPETAVGRMLWARSAVQAAYPAV
jgi:choline dehydrogenase-like flavoprotein